MKVSAFVAVVIAASAVGWSAHGLGQRQDTLTFYTIMNELIGKKVIVLSTPISKELRFLDDWTFAKEVSPRNYVTDKNWLVPMSYRGAEGTVVAITPYDTAIKTIDAFGELVKATDLINPAINIVVKLSDGTLMGQRGNMWTRIIILYE